MASNEPPAAAESDPSDSQQPCFFFKPPAEIRVRIYEFAFSPDTEDDPVTDGKLKHDGDCSQFPCVTRDNWHTRSALLQVSQLIRKEAMPIFYKHSTFHLRVNKRNFTGTVEWLEGVGMQQTKLISRLFISWEPTERIREKFIAIRRAKEGAESRRRQRILEGLSSPLDSGTMVRSALSRLRQHYNPLFHGRSSSPESPDETDVDYFAQLLALRSSETTINRGIADAFGQEVAASGIRPNAVVLEEIEPGDPLSGDSVLGDRFLDQVHADFMGSLKVILFGMSDGEDEDEEE